MIPAGGASLGFVGPAMGVAVAGTHPISELYSSGAIELGLQLMGAMLTQLSSGSKGYTVLSLASWVIALAMLVGFVPPEDQRPEEQTEITEGGDTASHRRSSRGGYEGLSEIDRGGV